ncbi:MAG: type II secretion system F family protein [Planctomycetes bacterium]|nr:type II secretion system F family protein [Planctomycetota bacterium]
MAVLEQTLKSSNETETYSQGAGASSASGGEDAQQTTMQKIMSFSIESGPGRKDILFFTNQLSVMIRAGISLQEALDLISEQIEKKKFKAILCDLKERIEGGQSFSQALAEHPKQFSNLYINMVAAAELSGSLSDMLIQLADYLDQEADTRSQVIGAMVYPMIIATMAVSCTSFLMMFVLPRFLKVFEGKEHLLPAPTKIVMATSTYMRGYWHVNICIIIAFIVGFNLFVKTDFGRKLWHQAKLKIPLLKKLFGSLYITRSLHTMGVLTNAGVPILDTISITASITGNVLFETMWRGVHEEVRQGKKIAGSLKEYKLLPSGVIQMIRSGEESGTLSDVLADVSEFYGRELKSDIKMVTSMIEPIMIVLMGVLVGFIASSIILPIFKMSSAVS